MYKINKELAGIVAMASELEQLALTEDIRQNGQRESAVLWRGEIVDGRCRQVACIALGLELRTMELDDKLSVDEVRTIVKSLNTRRNLTQTQKMMSAFKEQERQWRTNEEMAATWGMALGSYKNARYVATARPDFVDALFNGKSVVIVDPDKGREITTDKINTLARIIKKTKEVEVLVVDTSEVITFSVDSLIKTEAGKEWYYGKMSTLSIPDSDVAIRMDYVELANYKFKVVPVVTK